MSDINKVILIGRLTKDASLKFTNQGLAICTFSIAVNRSVKHGDRWEKVADFFDCTTFGKQGEAVAQYMTKGSQIGIEGELRQERWEKDGQKHSKISVIANNIQLLGGGKREAGQPEQPLGNSEQFEDDIPF